MFFTYLSRELRRRSRQVFVIALGLALGIGLTITVTAASAGVKTAQGKVLHSLYGVGTDMTVTETAAQGSGGPQNFSFTGPQADGTSGTKTSTSSQDNLSLSPGTAAISSATLTKISQVGGVSKAVGSLTLTDFKIDATMMQKIQQYSQSGGGMPSGGMPSFGASSGGDISANIVTVAGVDTADTSVGPLAALSTSSGRAFTAADSGAHVAVLTASYASSKKLALGSTLKLASDSYTVVGLVKGSTSTNVFIPLSLAQKASSQAGKVSTIYIKAGNATQIDTVAAAIKKADTSATVTTSADLANSVTGSLASTASLANNLGKWLSIAVLIAAFAMAALFTMSAVGRRVREFGTLKALGWTSRRVVRQVMGEAVVTGLLGGALGIGLGYGGAVLIDKLAPSLSASTGGGSSPTGSGIPAGFGGQAPRAASTTVSVHLSAPVSINVLLLAVMLAVLGGLIAGGFGGWRASSLRPADALRKVA